MYRVECWTDDDISELRIIRFHVIKRTKCGVWIGYPLAKNKFINTNMRKQYAYDTIEKAKEGFIKRKERQIKILEYQLRQAKKGIKLCIDSFVDKL